jgi:N-acyl-D-aspartate/D-glutamate deacylase
VQSRLGVTIEDWVKRGKRIPLGRQELLDKYAEALSRALLNPEMRERIKRLTVEGAPDKLNWVPMFGWDSFTMVESPGHPELFGLTIAEVARDQRREDFDIAAELLIEQKNNVIISVFTMSEEGIARALKREWMMVGSDAGASAFKPGIKGHPGAFGTFARIFRKYVREEELLTLEEAVRKLSLLPARFLGLGDRGILREGYKADIVVFSPETIEDRATYNDAHQFCTGIVHVLVNGKLSIEEGHFNNRLNGRVLLLGRDKESGPSPQGKK